jgi:hypothetical protein
MEHLLDEASDFKAVDFKELELRAAAMHEKAFAKGYDKFAYEQILAARQRNEVVRTADKDEVLAVMPHEYGGVEMLVRKADGVVVLLVPQGLQVKNTPKGPKNFRPQAPYQLPLVRTFRPTEIALNMTRVLGRPAPPALLLFQDRVGVQMREFAL